MKWVSHKGSTAHKSIATACQYGPKSLMIIPSSFQPSTSAVYSKTWCWVHVAQTRIYPCKHFISSTQVALVALRCNWCCSPSGSHSGHTCHTYLRTTLTNQMYRKLIRTVISTVVRGWNVWVSKVWIYTANFLERIIGKDNFINSMITETWVLS